MSNVSANQHASCSHIISSFQDSGNSNDNFQLHYLLDERRFHLIEKGKVEGEIIPHVLKGKQGKESLVIESRQPNLNAIEINVDELVFKRSPQYVLVNCRSSIIVNDFVSTNSMKIFPYDKFVVGNSVEDFRLNLHEQSVIVCHKDYSHTKFDLNYCHILIDGDFVLRSGTTHLLINRLDIGKIFDEVRINQPKQNLGISDKRLTCQTHNLLVCDENLNLLICCVNSAYLCKFVRIKLEIYDCLNLFFPSSSLFGMYDFLMKKKFLWHCDTSDQNYVFKPGVFFHKSMLSEDINAAGLQSQTYIFYSEGCPIFWFKRFNHVLQDYVSQLLHDFSELQAMKLSSQLEKQVARFEDKSSSKMEGMMRSRPRHVMTQLDAIEIGLNLRGQVQDETSYRPD
ncbi:hypothetical protein PVK06_024548 [Gossypium arboreum]|uniref:Uncharacterized protein n=1 Tax=Gossypium arboreum TaxID=29729 RepID=A0ABR0PE91_GOSAR|nr:hypothetical protein PVK06_024548 [Gossypium arboreum]